MSVYLDACVLVPLFVVEERSPDVRTFVRSVGNRVVVSELAIAEFGAAISRHVRSDSMTKDAATTLLALFDDWVSTEATRLTVEAVDIRLASRLVREFELKLLTPDAIHLALCKRDGQTLVTLDQRLRDAAILQGVDCVVP